MKKLFLIILFGVLSSLPPQTYATSFSTLADALDGGFGRNDSKTATMGAITSRAELSPGYHLMSSASASEDGNLAVRTYGGSWDIFSHYAEASWTNTFINNSSKAISYQFLFSVSGGLLDIRADSLHYDEFFAEYSVDILLNGSSLWNTSAKIAGDYLGTSTLFSQTGTDLGGNFVDDFTTDPNDYDHASYAFNPYIGSVDLGTIASGDSFTLEYIISVQTAGCDHGMADAILGDPLSFTPGVYGTVASHTPVPEPCTFFLFCVGLAGVAGFRSKSRKP